MYSKNLKHFREGKKQNLRLLFHVKKQSLLSFEKLGTTSQPLQSTFCIWEHTVGKFKMNAMFLEGIRELQLTCSTPWIQNYD